MMTSMLSSALLAGQGSTSTEELPPPGHWWWDAVAEKAKRDPAWWFETFLRIKETGGPIQLMPHQRAILRYALQRRADGRFRWKTVIFSAPKKSGKTEIAAGIVRLAAETWGLFQEIYCVGNDATQARERAYGAMCESIELEPGYQQGKRELPKVWTTSMPHPPVNNQIQQ